MSVQNSFVLFDLHQYKLTKQIISSKQPVVEMVTSSPFSKDQNQLSSDKIYQKSRRKPHHLFLFIVMNICLLGITFQDYLYFLGNDKTVQMIFSFTVVGINYVFSIVNSCLYVDSKKQLFMIYFLLDNITITLIAAIVGLFGIFMNLMDISNPVNMLSVALLSGNLFLMAGNYRVVLAKCEWKFYQVIIAKLTLLCTCLGYLTLAVYYLKSSGQRIKSQNANVNQDSLGDFFFLYVFGLMTLNIEIYSKITDLDGTSQLTYRYTISDPQEDEKYLISQPTNNPKF